MVSKLFKKTPFVLLAFLLAGSIFSSCKKDDDKGVQTKNEDNNKNENPGYKGSRTVYILNEGTFNKGNASLTRYQPSKGTMDHKYFREKNGRPLGDVFQSMLFHQNRAFLVINNSGKIEVVDSATFQSLGSIRSLPSPRYLMPIGSGKGYVTNFTLGDNSEISIVDINAYKKTGAIQTGGWTGQMVKASGRIWVAEVDKGALLVIEPDQHSVKDTLQLQKQIQEVVKDREGMIWTLSNGGLNDGNKPVLYRIDPDTKTVEKRFIFPQKSDQPGELTFNARKDTLYFLNDGIYKMSIYANQLPATPVVESKGSRSFYSLGVDPVNGRIYTSDALGYVQRGFVFTFNPVAGNPVDTFKAGIIPRGFRFIR